MREKVFFFTDLLLGLVFVGLPVWQSCQIIKIRMNDESLSSKAFLPV